MSSLQSHYSAPDIETRILAGLQAAGLDPEQGLTPEQLAPLDQFHTGGLRASLELLEVAPLAALDSVLDIWAGLAGAARLLASRVGCTVDCIEMSEDYCTGATLLNRLTGMQDRITMRQGSVLSLPYADDSFDLVWMQNVGMNIADKARLYAEISRVLKPGGRYAFQEMASGPKPLTNYPLPWATLPADNCLSNPDQMRAGLSACGFVAELFEDTSDLHISRTAANATDAVQGQLGLGVFVENLGEKAANARRSLENAELRLMRGVFRLGTAQAKVAGQPEAEEHVAAIAGAAA